MEIRTFYKEIKQKSTGVTKRFQLADLSDVYNYNPDKTPSTPESRVRQ